jgi:uncharacterized protein Yka (UPF0111/DUF47 family)
MPTKAGLLERIGERSLLLPELINRGLEANDRLKYYLTLMQTAYVHAQAPGQEVLDLRSRREASGVSDPSLDEVVGASRMVTNSMVYIPGIASIIEHALGDARHMVEPIAAAAAWHTDLAERAALYGRRLDEQAARAPANIDDEVPTSTIDAFTRLPGNGHDSLHQLVMDLHWELNRLQASVSVEVIDGAHAYGLGDSDRRLVRAFMKGINETAPLKFDHPGLETTATRDGDHLSIQNALGATDGHVVVVHVAGPAVTLIYTDVRRARAKFVRDLLAAHKVTWSTDGHGQNTDGNAQNTDGNGLSTDVNGRSTGGFDVNVGSYTAADDEGLERFLSHLGSRLVFLIDWTRARKRLSRVVKKSDATELLKWAADNNIGHEAFLKAGDVKLIHNALDRAAPTQIHYGARLDEILGRDAAKRFLMSVLRIASAGVARRSSPRLIDDEIEAELMMYLQRSDRSFLGAIADHAMVVAGIVEWIRRAIAQLKRHERVDGSQAAALLKSWKIDADAIIRRTWRGIDSVEHGAQLRRLLSQGDKAVRALQEAAFILTLVPTGIDGGVADLLDQLADLASRAVTEYIRCLEDARDLSRGAARPDLERFLVTVDRLVNLEDSCDEAERAIRERVLRGPSTDFREVYVLSELTRGLDRATDSVVQSGLLVRDYVLSIAPGA